MTSPAKKKTAVADAMKKHHTSERRACRALNLNRSGLRYMPVLLPKDGELTNKIIELATNYGRYGYRKITRMVNNLGYNVNHKKVERIWREQGLRVPKRQQKKRRLFLNDGSCIRLRAEHKNHVWSYDFVYDELSNHRSIRWLNIIDEYTRECLFTMPAKIWRNGMIIEVLSALFMKRGVPEYIRSDNGPEFIAKKLKEWIHSVGVVRHINLGSIRHFKLVEKNIKQFAQHINLCFFCALF